jgi:integrase
MEDVDFERDVIHIKRSIGKQRIGLPKTEALQMMNIPPSKRPRTNKRPKMLPLPAFAVEALREMEAMVRRISISSKA